MSKQAVSVTLDRENIVWLRARALASRRRSLSAALDHLISEARTMRQDHTADIRSVVGSIRLPSSDPDLRAADAAIRTLFDNWLNRGPSTVRRAGRRPRRPGRPPRVSRGSRG